MPNPTNALMLPHEKDKAYDLLSEETITRRGADTTLTEQRLSYRSYTPDHAMKWGTSWSREEVQQMHRFMTNWLDQQADRRGDGGR